MNKKGIAIVVALLVILLPVIYWKLGGFNPIQVYLEEQQNIKLLGLRYRGTPQDPGMTGTFREIEKLLGNYPDSRLHTLYFVEPAGKLDTLEVFVGLAFHSDIANQEALEVLEVECRQVIVARLDAHRLVMPSPEKVKGEIETFAKSNGLSTQGLYIDKILDERRVEVYAPIK
ncbi:MAG TPA: hypothetical protein VK014_01970 [Cyclobacteriaceae bacterium]|nr:hypothetical protein [Cyclobacteriaceae bacterium]